MAPRRFHALGWAEGPWRHDYSRTAFNASTYSDVPLLFALDADSNCLGKKHDSNLGLGPSCIERSSVLMDTSDKLIEVSPTKKRPKTSPSLCAIQSYIESSAPPCALRVQRHNDGMAWPVCQSAWRERQREGAACASLTTAALRKGMARGSPSRWKARRTEGMRRTIGSGGAKEQRE